MLRGLGHFLSSQIWDGVPGPDNGHWSLSPVGGLSVHFWCLVMNGLQLFFFCAGENFFLGDEEQSG